MNYDDLVIMALSVAEAAVAEIHQRGGTRMGIADALTLTGLVAGIMTATAFKYSNVERSQWPPVLAVHARQTHETILAIDDEWAL